MIVLLLSCAWIDDAEHREFIDGDGDGYCSDAFSDGDDCDDQDRDVHPDALEVCNSQDDDCDGAVDEGCDSGESDTDTDTDTDADSDADSDSDTDTDVGGRWSGSLSIATAADYSWITQTTGSRAGYALDWVRDINGDGKDDVVLIAPGNGSGGSVRLYATPFTEAMGVTDADRAWTGGTGFGWPAGIVGDVDGDGSDDLVLSSESSEVTLLLGPLPSATTTGGRALTYSEGQATLRGMVGLGDMGGDGSSDLALSLARLSDSTGRVAVWEMAPSTGASWDEADTVISVPRSSFGAQLAAGDFDGDGTPDLALGADGAGSGVGEVWFADGPLVSGAFAASTLSTSVTGEDASALAGFPTVGVGDTDGDGYDDLLVGAAQDDEGGTYAGAVYLLPGPPSGWPSTLSGAEAKVLGSNPGDGVGSGAHSPGDTDGDGRTEIVIVEDNGDRGRVFVFYGPLDSGTQVAEDGAALVVTGEDGDLLGKAAIQTTGDNNGDGYPDLLLGASFRHSGDGGADIILAPGRE